MNTNDEAVWRKRVEAAAEALADVLPGEVGRLDLLARISALRAERDDLRLRLTALEVAGAKLSAHVDRTAGGSITLSEMVQNALGIPDHMATPWHPERVKERSEAFSKEAVTTFDGCQNDRERVCYAAGRERGLDEGAEAMRAAVEAWARDSFGSVPPTLKAAAEGATHP